MLNKKEIITIILVTIVLAFSVSLLKTKEIFLYSFLSIFLILMINIISKKVASFYLDSEIEINLWKIKKYGWTAGTSFKKPIPAGLMFPLIFTTIFLGNFVWLASTTFEVKPKTYRAVKRHPLYAFSEITEHHMGLIAAAGIISTLFFAIVGYLIGLPNQMNFVKLSAMYAFFNMLPLSDLDGNKIFFGNLTLWSFLACLVLIGVFAIIFIT